MNTLRGVFPEPKPAYKRNFIQENMRQLKHMQGIFNKVEVLKSPNKLDRFQNIPARAGSLTSQKKKSKQSLIQSASYPTSEVQKHTQANKKIKKPLSNVQSIEHTAVRSLKDPRTAVADVPDSKYRDMGVQTETISLGKDIHKHTTGNKGSKSNTQKQQNMSGDFGSMIISNPHDEGSSKAKQEENKPNKDSTPTVATGPGKRGDTNKIPAGYQRGVVPKYLRDRQKKETELKNTQILDPDCPAGHVTIPDAERKETLRALRQSYADLVAELNLMPVKTDTLRTRNRKIELEKQLNKIEEGIKVFSRPKVFVKINS